MNKFLLNILFLILFSIPVIAQPPLPSTSGSIVILSGGSVLFNFNSLSRYKNGITLTDYTKLAIKYDADSGSNHWRLAVRSTTANFTSDSGYLMDLDVLEITPSDDGGNNSLAAVLGSKDFLNFADVDLVASTAVDYTEEGTALDDNLVNLTYECGVTNSVMDFHPDYYTLDLEITLYED